MSCRSRLRLAAVGRTRQTTCRPTPCRGCAAIRGRRHFCPGHVPVPPASALSSHRHRLPSQRERQLPGFEGCQLLTAFGSQFAGEQQDHLAANRCPVLTVVAWTSAAVPRRNSSCSLVSSRAPVRCGVLDPKTAMQHRRALPRFGGVSHRRSAWRFPRPLLMLGQNTVSSVVTGVHPVLRAESRERRSVRSAGRWRYQSDSERHSRREWRKSAMPASAAASTDDFFARVGNAGHARVADQRRCARPHGVGRYEFFRAAAFVMQVVADGGLGQCCSGASSLPVWRVSSQAMRSTERSTRSARRVMSSRLPMGVATRYRPGANGAAVGGGARWQISHARPPDMRTSRRVRPSAAMDVLTGCPGVTMPTRSSPSSRTTGQHLCSRGLLWMRRSVRNQQVIRRNYFKRDRVHHALYIAVAVSAEGVSSGSRDSPRPPGVVRARRGIRPAGDGTLRCKASCETCPKRRAWLNSRSMTSLPRDGVFSAAVEASCGNLPFRARLVSSTDRPMMNDPDRFDMAAPSTTSISAMLLADAGCRERAACSRVHGHGCSCWRSSTSRIQWHARAAGSVHAKQHLRPDGRAQQMRRA